MGERINIAAMAEEVSKDLFGKVGWQLHGTPNESWACTNPVHQKADHPTDATFVYQDPYSGKNVHLITDLKSYAAGSITSTALKQSIESLALTVDCAKDNPNWKDLYLKAGNDFEIQGLLFIYNHDGDYDRSFATQLVDAMEEGPRIPRGVRLSVMGPEDVWYLNEVLSDLATLAQDKVVPYDLGEFSFYYPSQSRERFALSDRSKVATIDVLKGKYQLMTYVHQGRRGMLVYYRGPGKDVREFIVLIDMLRTFGILDDAFDEIHVRSARPTQRAANNFSNAVAQYSERAQQTPQKLQKIKFGSVAQVRPRITQFEVANR